MHYALRYAHAAAKSCIDRDNIALGVCYISLGVRVATKGTDLEALLLLLDDVSSTISEQEGAYRSTYDHIAKVRVSIKLLATHTCSLNHIALLHRVSR